MWHRPPPALYSGMLVIDLVAGNAESEALWKAETKRRFPNAVLVLCHGFDLDGEWVMVPQARMLPVRVKDFAQQLHDEFGGHRPVVLVCCNPGRARINVPGVYHALDVVWMRPDKAGNLGVMEPKTVGNIFEFTDDSDLPGSR